MQSSINELEYEMDKSYITEPCGARWSAFPTEAVGERAFWVLLVEGQSQARPNVVGFYAASINAAEGALKRAVAPRSQSRNVIDGYNVEFLGARPAKAGEDY